MTILKMILWIVMCLAAGALLYFIQLPLRRSKKKWAKWVRIVLWPIKAFLVALLAYSTMSIAVGIIWRHQYIFGAIYVALTADVFAELINLLIKSKKIQVIVVAVLTIAYLAYGTINEAVIRPVKLSYSSEKLQNSYKIAFVSDLHYGSSQYPSTIRKALEEIKAENPDYLILGGDLVDEHTTKQQMEDIFSMIGELDLTTYYIYGNHDQQERAELLGGKTFSKEELDQAITENGIAILCNDVVELEDDLTVIGIDDSSHPDTRAAVEALPESDPNSYTVFLDHSPYQTEDTEKLSPDLQLSGHTHAGQLFPLRLIYPLVVPATYGKYQIGDTQLYVSSGLTGWYYPFRTAAHCEYVIITLSPVE